MSEFGPSTIDSPVSQTENREGDSGNNRFMQWLRDNKNNRFVRVLVPFLLSLSVSGVKAENEHVATEAAVARATASLAERFTGAKSEEVTVNGVRCTKTDCPLESLDDKLADYLYETEENLTEIGTPGHTERAIKKTEQQIQTLAKDAPDPTAIETIAPTLEREVAETINSPETQSATISTAAARMAEYQQYVRETIEQFNRDNRDSGRNPDQEFNQNFQKVILDTLADANKTGETSRAYRQLEDYVTNTLEEEMAIKVKDTNFDSVIEALDFFFTNVDYATTEFAINQGRGREGLNPYIAVLQRMKDKGLITDQEFSVLERVHTKGTKDIFNLLNEEVEGGNMSAATRRLITGAHLAMEAFACLNNMKVYTGNETLLLPRIYLKKGGEGTHVFFQFAVSPDGRSMRSGKPPKFTISGLFLGATKRF
ncbi:MAG: hypothetical protein AAB360_01810 [Patescibacteria group bacterium]